MKEIYILFINLIISIITSITRSYLSNNSEDKSEENTEVNTIYGHRNTFYKLLSLKKRLEMQKHSKNND